MKVVVFGATGRTGSEVVLKALQDGHEVMALVRTLEKCATHDRLTLIQGDVRNPGDVKRVMKGAEAVFSALGTDRTTTLTEAMPVIIKTMEQQGISRIVTIGTAGILQSHNEPSKLRYQAKDSNRKLTFAAEEHHKVFDLLRHSTVDWTIVCPTYLPAGEAVGNYRIERDFLPIDGKQVSTKDTAAFAYDEFIKKEHIGYRVGIAY